MTTTSSKIDLVKRHTLLTSSNKTLFCRLKDVYNVAPCVPPKPPTKTKTTKPPPIPTSKNTGLIPDAPPISAVAPTTATASLPTPAKPRSKQKPDPKTSGVLGIPPSFAAEAQKIQQRRQNIAPDSSDDEFDEDEKSEQPQQQRSSSRPRQQTQFYTPNALASDNIDTGGDWNSNARATKQQCQALPADDKCCANLNCVVRDSGRKECILRRNGTTTNYTSREDSTWCTDTYPGQPASQLRPQRYVKPKKQPFTATAADTAPAAATVAKPTTTSTATPTTLQQCWQMVKDALQI
jgi:hypothetical protein